MQTFIFGLLLACVSGVTVVAFRHPNGYARLFPYLLAVTTALFIGFTVWHIAVEVSWTKLLQFMDRDNFAAATDTKSQLRLPYIWVVFWYFGVATFVLINLKLPPFLQVTDDHSAPTDEENSH